MKINRIQNTKRNVFWGMIEKIITLLLPFVLRTVMIRVLGKEVLGLNTLFTSILQVLNMAELGFSGAVVYNMYKPIAENDSKTICALMALYRKVYYVIGCVVVTVGLALLPFLPKLINGEVPQGYNIYILYIIHLLNTGVSYFLFAYKNCLLNAYQRNDVISKVSTLTHFIQYAYQFFVLIFLKDYYLYLAILPAISILNNIINALIVSKMYPNYKPKGVLSKEQRDLIKQNVTGLMVGKICIVSRNSFDSIFLSAFINLSVVTMYGNYYYILTALNTFLAVVMNSMLSGIGNSIVAETKEKNYHDFRLFNFMFMWIYGWCTVCLVCLYQPFMKVWMGEDLMFPFFTVILFCIYFYSLKLSDIRSVYSTAAGLFWQNRKYVIAEVIANVILNFAFVKIWGVNGIIVATNISIIFINFVWGTKVLFNNYFTEMSFFKFILEQLLYALITAFNCVITYLICNLFCLNGLLDFAVKGCICLIVSNLFYWIVYRKTIIFADSKRFALRIIKKHN